MTEQEPQAETQDARLDAEVTRRGLARSRTHAARLIQQGEVSVDGVVITKSGFRVAPAAGIEVAGQHDYVSRAADKLLAVFEADATLSAAGRVAIDVGASTGGFTQVLRARGARHVVCLDVGHGQLADAVKADPGVTNLEGVNARFVDGTSLDELLEGAGSPVHAGDIDLLVADVSFISLTQVLPSMLAAAPAVREAVLLIKPQFEVGRTGVKGGIVENTKLIAPAVERVLDVAAEHGLRLIRFLPSPITGTHGNSEFIGHFRTSSGPHPVDAGTLDGVRSTISAATERKASR